MNIKRFFKVNSNEIVIFKVNFNFKYEKFRVFVTFYIPRSGAGAGPKNFGSGSGSSEKMPLHRLRNTEQKYRVYDSLINATVYLKD
jgi:hypothetical protein